MKERSSGPSQSVNRGVHQHPFIGRLYQDIIAILGMEELSEEDLAKAELPEEVDAALDLAKTAETRIDLLGK